jgi:single-strand DNA-binding protein
MNVVHLFGNLGKDPEVRYSQAGNAVATLSLATSHRVKNGDDWEDATEWHRLVCFGRRAEVLGEHATKGTKLAVTGRLQTRKWQDQSGNDRYTTEVVVQDFDFGGSSGAGKPSKPNEGGFREPAPDFQDDDIPF